MGGIGASIVNATPIGFSFQDLGEITSFSVNNDSILIDFNRAYNPQCVYDENFSCPIVPRENLLNFRVEAGVKNFISSY